MKGFAFALLTLVGCDQVFDLDRGEPVAADAPLDAATTTVVSLEVPAAVSSGEMLMVTATLSGIPRSTVTCTFSANAGAFAASDVVVELDDNGLALPSALYTAPVNIGIVTLRATADDSTETEMLDVRPPIVIGHDSTSGAGLMDVPTGRLIGTRFVPPAGVLVRQVGVWASPTTMSGTQARIGIYDANRLLIGSTGSVTVQAGRNVYPLATELLLLQPSIYVIVMFDRVTSIYGRPTAAADGFFANTASDFAVLPVMLPASTAQMTGYSVFVVGI